MNCLVWNGCRLRNLYIGNELGDIIRVKDQSVVFIAETLADEVRLHGRGLVLFCWCSLPTKDNLQCRTIFNNAVCDKCKLVPESAIHTLWSCTELDVVWEDVSLWSHQQASNFSDFKELLSWLISTQHHLELFSVTA